MKTKNLIDKVRSEKKFEETEGVAFEINAEALEHIMSTLTNLYSDVKTAIFREYLSNARDSHVLAGCDTPVLVTLPDYTNGMTLTIQDFGVGMSLKQINKIYRKYGSSTKNTDNNAIGGFGLGGKSALAISDTFSGVSIKNGEKVTFHVEKRADNLPYLVVDNVEDTDEKNGVKITIPYKAQISEENLPRLLSGFPKNSVKLTNSKFVFRSVWDEKLYRSLKHLNGDVLGWYSSEKDLTKLGAVSMISVGGVLYPINAEKIPGELAALKNIVESVNRIGFTKVINLPVGSVKFTPSREDLVFNEQTVNTLIQFFEAFKNGLENDLQNRLNSDCSTRQEAIKFVTKWEQGFKNHFWRGEKVVTKISARQEGMYRAFRAKTLTVDAYKVTGQHIDEFFRDRNSLHGSGKRVILIHDKEFETHREAKEYYRNLLRLKMKQIQTYFKISDIFIVPREFAKNEWFEHFPTNEKITVTEYLEKVAVHHQEQLKIAREERKNSNVSAFPTVKKEAKYRYRVIKFTDTEYSAVQVNTDDAALKNKKVAYIAESNYNFGISLSSSYATTNAKLNPYMRLVKEHYKGYTVFVVTNRQDDTKILTEYPKIKIIGKDIINLATTRFNKKLVEKGTLKYSEFSQYMNGSDRAAVTLLKDKYVNFKSASKIRIAKLDDFLTKVELGTGYSSITDFDDLVPRKVREEKMLPFIQEFQGIVQNFGFFRYLMSYPGWKSQIKAIEKVVENM